MACEVYIDKQKAFELFGAPWGCLRPSGHLPAEFATALLLVSYNIALVHHWHL